MSDEKKLNVLLTTEQAAKILNVKPVTLKSWRNRKIFGVPYFPADEMHANKWYYYKERIEQLKEVYHPGILNSMYELEILNESGNFHKTDTRFDTNAENNMKESGYKFQSTAEKKFKAGLIDENEVAEIFETSLKTIQDWREKNILVEDLMSHNGIYFYAKDRVLEFKKLFHKGRPSDYEGVSTEKFFETLYAYADEGTSYIWYMPEKITLQAENFQVLAKFAGEFAQQKDVYFSVGLTDKKFKKYERAKGEDIIGIPALWIDIDIADKAHKAENLPQDYESAISLLPPMLEPSIIVHSGHGIHVYYVFKEILTTKTDEEKIFAKNLLSRLQGYVRNTASQKGWHVSVKSKYLMNRVTDPKTSTFYPI